MKRTFLAFLLVAVVAASAGAQTREKASEELREVRGRIDALKKELESQGRRRSRAERSLADTEKAEQKIRGELSSVRKKIQQSRERQADLERQSDEQRARLEKQRAALSKQLRVAYINGNEEWLRVALNQQDASGLGRRMTYYGYLSRQRRETIEQVALAIAELEKIQTEIQNELASLAELESEAAEKLAEISEARAERAELVAKISADMNSKDKEMQRLQAQAKELTELVEALARVLPKMPEYDGAPFAGKVSSLAWPVDGQILKKFGAPRADGMLKWQGVLLGAPAGSPVRSVYHGRVVFADWLDGMGLLTIIDHGEGYMSLYGHNQTLLKDVGEWVDPGESIAQVGDSGGQDRPALYFEIRKDGKPVNPGRWIR